jgi:hypothetical protein
MFVSRLAIANPTSMPLTMLIQGSQKIALQMELGMLCAPIIHLLAKAVPQTSRRERSNYGFHVILV